MDRVFTLEAMASSLWTTALFITTVERILVAACTSQVQLQGWISPNFRQTMLPQVAVLTCLMVLSPCLPIHLRVTPDQSVSICMWKAVLHLLKKMVVNLARIIMEVAFCYVQDVQ